MKTITKTYNVYTIDELSEEAQERARKDYASYNDYFFMEDDMNNRLSELLEEYKVKDLNDTSKPGTKPTQVLYSLSYCQGDGCMFEGDFVFTYKRKKYTINVKHSGRYYHSYCKDFTVYNEDGEDVDNWQEVEKAFEAIYQNICSELETHGYNYMEYIDSLENFKETCYANDYLFTEDGKMFTN